MYYIRMMLVFGMVLVVAGTGVAQEVDDLMSMSLEDLMNLEVESTTKTKVNIRKAPGTVYSFSQKELKSYGIKSIDDIYFYFAGVQPYRYKKNNVTVLRGVINKFNNRTQHIVDGVVARNGYYNHEEFNDFIPLQWIESYDLILGPGSALYGANAFSGVSSLKLLGFQEQRELTVSTMAEFSPLLPQVTTTYRDKNIAMGLTWLSGEIPVPTYNITGEVFNQTSDYDAYHGFIKWNLFNQGKVFARYGSLSRPYLYNKDDKKIVLEQTPLVFGADFGYGESQEGGRIGVKADHTIQKNVEIKTEDNSEETQNATFTNAELTYSKDFSTCNLLFGVVYLREEATDIKNPDGTKMLQEAGVVQTNIAGFGQSIIPIIDPLTLTLGLRFDTFTKFDPQLNGRAALVYDITEKSTVKFLAGTAVRTPSLREWNKDLEDTDWIAPVPKSENLTTYELSYNQLVGNAYFDITLFQNSFTNMLLEQDTPPHSSDSSGGADEYFYNSEDIVKMQGVELNAKYRLNRLVVGASGSYLITDDGTGEEVENVRTVNYALNASYNYFKGHTLIAGINGATKPANYTEISDDKYLPGYVDSTGVSTEAPGFDDPTPWLYVNLTLTGPIIKNLSYTLGMRNITDALVYDSYFSSKKYRHIERQDKKLWLTLDYALGL